MLRTPDFLQYYRVSYSQGVWYITQNGPVFQLPSQGILTKHSSIPLDFDVRKTQGAVVPQERWIPAEIHRHEGVILCLPIFFVHRNSEIGFWLLDILQGRVGDLNKGDSEAALSRTTTHIRINVSSHTLMLAQRSSHLFVHASHSGPGVLLGDVRYPFETKLMPGIRSHLPVS